MKQDDNDKKNSNVSYGDPPCTADPLGVTVVMYGAGPLSPTVAYGGPPAG